MGLLDMQMQGATQPQVGLLGTMQPQGGRPQGVSPELQMAMQLSQNPTPQMVMQVIAQMQKSGVEGADEIAQYLQRAGDDPRAIKQIADAAVKALSQ